MTTTCAAFCSPKRRRPLLAGLAGGVAQTTPYIGHPAYKQMGARSRLHAAHGHFHRRGRHARVSIANLIELVPIAVLAPVLVFVALNITVQAFSAVPARHATAVAISFFPSIARLLTIELSNPEFMPPDLFGAADRHVRARTADLGVIVALGNGFIITATFGRRSSWK